MWKGEAVADSLTQAISSFRAVLVQQQRCMIDFQKGEGENKVEFSMTHAAEKICGFLPKGNHKESFNTRGANCAVFHTQGILDK